MLNKLLAASGILGFISSAQAAVPAAVTTSITEAGTDALTVGVAVLVGVAGLMAIHWMRREVK